MYENNWDDENRILDELKKWIADNYMLNENEIFTALDYDFDGNITTRDFRRFLIEKLKFMNSDFNDLQLERVLQQISISKNKFIGLNDIIK